MNLLILDWLQATGWKVIFILVVWLLAHLAVHRFNRRHQERLATLSGFLANLMRITVVLVFGAMVLTELGIPVAPIFAGAGIAGIVIGFGAQTLIKDLLAGLFVVLENQYVKGDRVKLGDVVGVVTAISLRTTTLISDDQVTHYIPNGTITVVSNYSRSV